MVVLCKTVDRTQGPGGDRGGEEKDGRVCGCLRDASVLESLQCE